MYIIQFVQKVQASQAIAGPLADLRPIEYELTSKERLHLDSR